jgi:hypothetical protein
MQLIGQNHFHAPINVEITGRILITFLGKATVTKTFVTDLNLARLLLLNFLHQFS